MLDFRDGEIAKRVIEQSDRRYQLDHACDADDVDLWHGRLYLRLFLRSLSCDDDVTKRTGMGAIKCLSDCLAQGRALRILDKHARPGERLERNPMQPDRAAKRTDDSNATDLSKHGFEARSHKFWCQLLFRSGVWDKSAVAFI